MNAAWREDNRFNRRFPQFLNVRVERDERESNNDSDHQPANLFRDTWLGAHPKLFDAGPTGANGVYGNCNAAIASITR